MARQYYEPREHTTSSAVVTEVGEAAGGGFRGALRGVATGILLMGALGAGLAIAIFNPATILAGVGLGVAGAVVGVLAGGVTVPILGGAIGAIFGASSGADRGRYRVQAEGLEARRQAAHDQELGVYRDIANARAAEMQAGAAQMQMAMQMQQQQQEAAIAAPASVQARVREQSVEVPAAANTNLVHHNDNEVPQTRIDAATIEAATRVQHAANEHAH